MPFVPGFIEAGNFAATAFSFLQPAEDAEALASPGGIGFMANAGATLLIGDAVYFSTTGVTVNKSTTQSLYLGAFAGVVVGGSSRRIQADISSYGILQAGTAGQYVIVQRSGIVLMVAGAAITANTNVSASGSVAGRVITTTGTLAVLGRALDGATTAGDVIRVLLTNTGGTASASDVPRIAYINVTPQQASISTGTKQFAAAAFDQFGAAFTDTFTWTSTTVAAATVGASTGLATKVAAGTTAIVATSVSNTNVVGFAILTVT